MKDFKKQSKFGRNAPGGRPAFSGRPTFSFAGGRSSEGPKEMFEAYCSTCGNTCEVPFQPNGKKPVYCRNCFVRDDAQDSRPSFVKKEYAPKRDFDRVSTSRAPQQGDSSMKEVVRELAAVNAKLDTLIRVLEKSA